jgi:hypothetical protein
MDEDIPLPLTLNTLHNIEPITKGVVAILAASPSTAVGSRISDAPIF